MDSLAQCHLWLTWETGAAIAPPRTGAIAATQPGMAAKRGRAIPGRILVPSRFPNASRSALGRRSLAITAGAIVLASSLGSPAGANNHRWGNTVYANTPPGYALNVRWGPGTSSGVYRRARRGEALQVTGVRRNGWVQLVDATWVAGNLISNNPVWGVSPLPPTGDNRNLATVITPQNFALNIRSGPGFNFQVVGQYLNGSRIPLTGQFNGAWAQLTNGNWVDSTHLQYSGPIHGGNQPQPPPTPQPSADVMEVQRLLRQLGFLPANFPISGIYDETTQNAVRQFQRVNGLPATGNVDEATWRALRAATNPVPLPSPQPSPDPSPDPTTPPINNRQRRVNTGDSGDAQIYNGPGAEFTLVRNVPNGTILTTTGNTTGNWTEVVEGGWIFTPWLDPI
jgi:uncharacterized protein YraI